MTTFLAPGEGGFVLASFVLICESALHAELLRFAMLAFFVFHLLSSDQPFKPPTFQRSLLLKPPRKQLIPAGGKVPSVCIKSSTRSPMLYFWYRRRHYHASILSKFEPFHLVVSGPRFLPHGVGNFALFRVPSLAVFSTLMCTGPIYALPLGYYIKVWANASEKKNRKKNRSHSQPTPQLTCTPRSKHITLNSKP